MIIIKCIGLLAPFLILFKESNALYNGETNGNLEIMGGVEVSPPHSQPWVVGLAFNVGDKTNCGGALIGKRHALSAAHCVHNAEFAGYVLVGEHDQTDPDDGQIFMEIKNVYVHPNYSPATGSWWDFTVLEFWEDVEYNDKVQPIKLPQVGDDCIDLGLTMDATGWGYWKRDSNGEPVGERSPVLRTVKQECLLPDYCTIPDFNNEIQICVGDLNNPDHSACSHDSGGPLSHINDDGDAVLFGVTTGPGCTNCHCDETGRWARVTAALPWIEEIINSSA